MTYRLQENDEAVLLTPQAAPTASVIWMHGLGADGRDFVPIVPQLGLPPSAGIRFVFPHAPRRAVTLNQGMSMRAWYDIRELSSDAVEDSQGILASATRLDEFIERERALGIRADRIVLAGFSQGGAMALQVGLRYRESLAGVLALSTYLPLRDRLASETAEANRNIAILMCHGLYDPVLTIQIGRLSRDALQALGYRVQWNEYGMQHEVCAEEIGDIARWLRRQLP
jgi:phospholipase/carboxylesterase